MTIKENNLLHLQYLIGKVVTPQYNGIFAADPYHDVKIVSIEFSKGTIMVKYTYIHTSNQICPYGEHDRCNLIRESFKQQANDFFSNTNWRYVQGGSTYEVNETQVVQI